MYHLVGDPHALRAPTVLLDVLNIGIPDEYVEHGNVAVLKHEIGIDSASITAKILAEAGSVKNGRQGIFQRRR